MVDFDKKYEGYIFIDEAGRGCLGGELVFTGVRVTGDVSYADDSKKTTFAKREKMVEQIKKNVDHFTLVISAKEIDATGLGPTIKKCLEAIVERFGPDESYLFDGNNKFGVQYQNLETLVKADSLVKGVGAASIIAKHTKDLLMLEHHEEFPMYHFSSNFGYITKQHVEAIKNHGYCSYHRKSYKVKALSEWKNKQTTSVLF